MGNQRVMVLLQCMYLSEGGVTDPIKHIYIFNQDDELSCLFVCLELEVLNCSLSFINILYLFGFSFISDTSFQFLQNAFKGISIVPIIPIDTTEYFYSVNES